MTDGGGGAKCRLTAEAKRRLPPWARRCAGVYVLLAHQALMTGLTLVVLLSRDLGLLTLVLGVLAVAYAASTNRGGACPLRDLEAELLPELDLGDLLARALLPKYVSERDRHVLTAGKLLVGLYFAALKIAGVLALLAFGAARRGLLRFLTK